MDKQVSSGMNCGLLLETLKQTLQTAAASDCPNIIGQLEELKAMLWARLILLDGTTRNQPAQTENESYLTVGQVMKEFQVTDKWLYRNKKKLPHSQPSRKVLLFPAAKIRQWFASRKS